MEPTEDLDGLIAKVKDIEDGPDGDLLRRLVDILHDRYDYEPLSLEELLAVQEADEAIRRGDKGYFTSWNELKKELGL